MKWINHQILTGVVVYTATDSLLFAACSMAGAVLPDKLEGNPRQLKNYWQWRSRHRGWSHWPLPYLVLLLGLVYVNRYELGTYDMWDMSILAIYILLGAVLHILEDAVCGKVPLFWLWQKRGIKLFKVGSFREYFFTLGAVLLLYLGKMIYWHLQLAGKI